MLQNWLFPRLREDNFIWQQDGAPLSGVAKCVNNWMGLYHRRIERHGPDNLALLSRPPRSLNLTPSDFFMWDFDKDNVYDHHYHKT